MRMFFSNMLDERFIINERFFPELKMVDNRLVNALLLLYESDQHH